MKGSGDGYVGKLLRWVSSHWDECLEGDFKSSLWDSEEKARKLMVILTRSILSTTFRSRPA